MLKNVIMRTNDDGEEVVSREEMILEEGETLESVRNPEKRKEILNLIEALKVEFDANCTPEVPAKNNHGQITPEIPTIFTEKATAMMDQLLQLLYDHFLPTCPPELDELCREAKQVLKDFDSVDFDTCYNSTFTVAVIRKTLFFNSIQIIYSPLWKEFARNYTHILMSA